MNGIFHKLFPIFLICFALCFCLYHQTVTFPVLRCVQILLVGYWNKMDFLLSYRFKTSKTYSRFSKSWLMAESIRNRKRFCYPCQNMQDEDGSYLEGITYVTGTQYSSWRTEICIVVPFCLHNLALYFVIPCVRFSICKTSIT